MNREAMNQLTGRVIGAAISVHQVLGAGLDEGVYETALSMELDALGIRHDRQAPLPLNYKGVRLDCGYRLDLWIERSLIVEVKSVERVAPIHEAQLLTYLRLAPCELGLLLNFDVPVLKQGIRRRIWTADRTPPEPHAPDNCRQGFRTFEPMSGDVLAAAVEVHRHLGPGLLRSAYEECLCRELSLRGIPFERAKIVPACYRGVEIPQAIEVALLVGGELPVMCLSVPKLSPLDHARLLSQLRLGNWRAGLLINFNVTSLSKSVRRVVNSS